mgnify:CR=1 FL=1
MPVEPKKVSTKMLVDNCQVEVEKIYEKMEGMKKRTKVCRENSTLTVLEVSKKLQDTLGFNSNKQTSSTETSSKNQLDTKSLFAEVEFASDRGMHLSLKPLASEIMVGQTRQDSLEDSTKMPEFSMAIDDL